MNKTQLVTHMAESAGITKKQATAALEMFIEQVGNSLKKGKRVTLVGFGTFTLIRRKARNSRNPATGEAIRVKAKKVVRFRAGFELQEKIS